MRWLYAIGAIVAVVVLFLLVGVLGNLLSPGPQGPALSSYSTAPEGLAGWAALLAQDGHPVRQIRGSLASAHLTPRTTLVVLPDPTQAMATRLRAFVRGGGRLVIGAPAAARAVSGRYGRGRIVVVPRLATVENRGLGLGSNAAAALALVGAPGTPVAFDEAIHGYGAATGLAALPARWWAGLALLACAGAALLLLRGRRLGGPDPRPVPSPPPRSDYVLAVAEQLERAA